ncbi:MAG: hypothetical protein COW00_03140 [Bdellovibrio sp. CG12_big_fil_rev_8_21_14_0_65_39_13]|nr:MAG: hypothetical protein COW78_19265 [Bdellovibrio sp. CG22_combo_CG10-13_8_21_14_all_39_27]PIQ61687.1 MAG: hypothetical protein COW00_03140 [Bdellovibrio sp. CG12_big_fil_rev_8_21_14_0_65_39_13]PIR35630.1 MAG: hypothetical protein COV37_07525 [Bdellovibrio sp. CG11_big_fil_rev_8_21_14_0_20_39_38]PJB53420.1 MAG: hypothetical protein CO099_07195 [Bdellovibrio sp. CG_4_9_14_3_um_filter_39_7]
MTAFVIRESKIKQQFPFEKVTFMDTGTSSIKKKKLLENNMFNGIAIPIAIVLVGALIIFGVTKILSSERDYKDLVREVQSKTFGNRWVAAFELAKVLSAQKIPAEDIPWLIDSLNQAYLAKPDQRTREFLIVSLASLKNPLVPEIMFKALEDESDMIKFRAIMGLGNQTDIPNPQWEKVEKLLDSPDYALRQSAALTLMTHRVTESEAAVQKLLSDSESVVRFSAALGLINFKNASALETLKEILTLEPKSNGFREDQVRGLKMSLIEALRKNNWKVLQPELELAIATEPDLSVKAAMQETLILLKN